MKSKQGVLLVHVMEDRLRLAAGRSFRWRFDASEFVDIPSNVRGETGDGDWSNRLFKELERFVLANNLKGSRVIVALSRGLFIWRYFKVPPVPLENLDNLIGFEMEKHLPVKREEVYCRCLPVSQSADGWQVLLAATRRDILRPLEEALEMMGLKPAAIMPDLWGLIWLLKARDQALEGEYPVLVHLARGSAEVSVFRDGLPLFWRRFDRPELPQIEASGATSQAETLARDAEDAAVVIGRALGDAAREIGAGTAFGRGHLFADGVSGDLLIQKLAPAGVKEWREFRLSDLDFMKGPEGAARAGGLPVTAGLALAAEEARSCPVNLVPLPTAAKPRRPNWKLTGALAAILLLTGAFHLWSQGYQRRLRLDSLEKQISGLKSRVEAVKGLNDELKKQEATLRVLENAVTRRVLVVNILKELTKTIPDSAYLSQLTLKKNSLELSGFADAASGLISKLEASPLFKNVAFDAPITSQGQQKERFKIKLNLE